MDQAVEQPRRKAFTLRHALVNPIAGNAFAMKFVKEEKLSNIANTNVIKSPLDIMNTILPEGSENLLRVSTHSDVCDAILLRRPYARIIEGDLDVDGILHFSVDGERVSEGAIKKFLVNGMDDPILDEPFEWPKFQTQCIFLSGMLEDHGKGEIAVMEVPPSIFAPNGSQIRISATDVRLRDRKPIQIEAGFLAATYTTRGNGNYSAMKVEPGA